MLPRPFPFPFFWGTGRNLPRWYREQTRLPRPPREFSIPAPGPVTRTDSALLCWHREQGPPPPASRVVFLSPSLGLRPAQTQPFPAGIGNKLFSQAGYSRSLSGAPACLPFPPSGWAPRALSPATQKSPGASPQGIYFGRVKSAPSGAAALPAGAWDAPPPGSRNRPPPRRSTR